MAKVISRLDLASYSALVELNSGASPPSTDARGASTVGSFKEWGPLEYDATLATTSGGASKLAVSLDLASYSALVDLNDGTSPTTNDARGTAETGSFKEWGPLEYDSTLALTNSAAAMSGAAVAVGTVAVVGTNVRVDFTGSGTSWLSGTPTITPGAGSLGAITVDSDTACYATFTPPGSAQAVTFTDTTDNNTTAQVTVVAAATTVTMSGPTTGNTGVASTNFTIGISPAGAAVGASVTVTTAISPDGTTSANVTLNPGVIDPDGTFTVTAASDGAHTVSTSDNGGLTDPSSITYTTETSLAGTITDPNLEISPLNWHAAAEHLETINIGAYLKLAINDPDVAINVDVSHIEAVPLAAAFRPTIAFSIDDGAIQSRAFSADTPDGDDYIRYTLGSSLGGGQHEIEVWVGGIVVTNPANRWTPETSLRVRGFTRADGSQLSATSTWPYPRSQSWVYFGDSITQLSVTDVALAHWPSAISLTFDADWGDIGFGGQSWTAGAQASVPAFHTDGDAANSSWRWYFNGQSRLSGGLFIEQPDVIVVNLGTNGFTTPSESGDATDSGTRATIVDWLTEVRAAAPSALIVLAIPFGGLGRSTILAAKALSADSNVIVVDAASKNQGGGVRESQVSISKDTGGGTGFRSAEGVHPSVNAQAEVCAGFVKALIVAKPSLAGISTGGGGSGGGRRGGGRSRFPF